MKKIIIIHLIATLLLVLFVISLNSIQIVAYKNIVKAFIGIITTLIVYKVLKDRNNC